MAISNGIYENATQNNQFEMLNIHNLDRLNNNQNLRWTDGTITLVQVNLCIGVHN
jgi:hypothetical protein